jgi:hypothetical protein
MRWNPCCLRFRFTLSRDLYLLRTGSVVQTCVAMRRNENQPLKTFSKEPTSTFRSIHVTTQL